jgi:hypothetical protein
MGKLSFFFRKGSCRENHTISPLFSAIKNNLMVTKMELQCVNITGNLFSFSYTSSPFVHRSAIWLSGAGLILYGWCGDLHSIL